MLQRRGCGFKSFEVVHTVLSAPLTSAEGLLDDEVSVILANLLMSGRRFSFNFSEPNRLKIKNKLLKHSYMD